jgi:O-antigen biosynthesis protein WbqP
MGGIATRSTDSRITKIGLILRRTSLDELPQFFNIINGSMSIIGPRPILDWEFEEFKNNKTYVKRYDILPGMFCTVDLDFRADAGRDLQFQMDAEYSDNITFLGDCKVFFGIIKTVVSGKNVYKEEGKNDE